MKKGIGLIGAGYWGQNLARNFFELGALRAVADTHPDHLNRLKLKMENVSLIPDYKELLEDSNISAIAIAAPAAKHYELAKESLLAGKDVFVEKPMAMEESQAKELATLADQKNRILMVGHLLHYHPCFEKALHLVQTGALGKLHYISSTRLNLGAFRKEENVLWDFAPHDISMILALVGKTPEQVVATGGAFANPNIIDTVFTHLQFADNVLGYIASSWYHPTKEQKLIIAGSEAILTFNDTLPWEEKLHIVRRPVIPASDGHYIAHGEQREWIVVEKKEPLKQECLHFLECCKTRSKPRTDGWEGWQVVKTLEEAQRSLDKANLLI
jgi:UDP-2-acetamido-3-amino-2,3-dideoxy-glucuronate N-acetyltransferase